MHSHPLPPRRLTQLTPALLIAASVVFGGCASRVWIDDSRLAIVGTAPSPEAVVEPQAEPEPQPTVEVRGEKIIIHEKVQFDVNSARIKEVSHDLLDKVAQVIKQNPQIKKVRIEGHASAEGSDSHNMKLSDRRAKAVMKYLIGMGGIDKGMLTSKGYGETQPLNTSNPEREENRRVEFTILDQDVIATSADDDVVAQVTG